MVCEEYEQIVEFSFNSKQERFVVRFLNGKSYSLDITDLPKKMQTKKPSWDETKMSLNRNALLVVVGRDIREIPAHMIHARGREL